MSETTIPLAALIESLKYRHARLAADRARYARGEWRLSARIGDDWADFTEAEIARIDHQLIENETVIARLEARSGVVPA